MQNDSSKIKNEKKNENESKDKEEVVHLKQKISELENQVKRTLADYQNLEKRVAEQRRDLIINANKHLLLHLLPVLDTLILANKHLKDQGITLTIQQFLEILRQEGVKEIGPTAGAKFDPKLMECVEVAEGEEGRVISEVLTGYLLNEEILRPTMVRVGKKNIVKKEEDLAKKEIQKGDYM